MKKASKSWMLGGLAAVIALALGVGSAQAELTWTESPRGDGKTVVTFTSGSGTWTVPDGVSSVEVLVVGGGGGSDGWSGGSGAGGMYYTGSYGVTPGAGMTVTVGAGGAAISGDLGGGVLGNGGGLSQFGTQLIAYGGNAGADYNTPYGGDQGGYSLDGGTTTVSGNAFDGRTAYGPSYPHWSWFSGSGAGAAGAKGEPTVGGIGMQCDITGENLYYAGGGGKATVGGLGGGGTGYNAWGGVPTDGVDGLGGGAGGGSGLGGANGGDGIVVVAYAIPPSGTVFLIH